MHPKRCMERSRFLKREKSMAKIRRSSKKERQLVRQGTLGDEPRNPPLAEDGVSTGVSTSKPMTKEVAGVGKESLDEGDLEKRP